MQAITRAGSLFDSGNSSVYDERLYNRTKLSDMSSIKSITIPSSVERIEFGAFISCDNLDNVYFLGTEEQWNAIKTSELANANIIITQ